MFVCIAGKTKNRSKICIPSSLNGFYIQAKGLHRQEALYNLWNELFTGLKKPSQDSTLKAIKNESSLDNSNKNQASLLDGEKCFARGSLAWRQEAALRDKGSFIPPQPCLDSRVIVSP